MSEIPGTRRMFAARDAAVTGLQTGQRLAGALESGET